MRISSRPLGAAPIAAVLALAMACLSAAAVVAPVQRHVLQKRDAQPAATDAFAPAPQELSGASAEAFELLPPTSSSSPVTLFKRQQQTTAHIFNATLDTAIPAALTGVEIPSGTIEGFDPLTGEALELAANTDNLGAFAPWVTGAKNWRTGMTAGYKITPENPAPTSIDPNWFIPRSTPIFIFMGFNILLLVFTLIFAPFCACCYVYRRPKAADGKNYGRKKIYALVLVILQLVFCACLFGSNGVVSAGLQQTFKGMSNTFTATYELTNKARPVLSTMVSGIRVAVNGVVTDVTSTAHVAQFQTDFTDIGNALSTGLRDAQTQVNALKTAATNINSGVTSLSSAVTALNADLTAALNAANSINVDPLTDGSSTYRITTPLVVPTAGSFNIPNTGSAPSLGLASTQLDAVPDLNAQATTVDNLVADVGPQITTKFTLARTNILDAINPLLDTFANMVDNMLNPSGSTLGMVNNMIRDTIAQIAPIAPMAIQYDSYRGYAVLAMGLLILFAYLCTGIAMATKSPGTPRHCGCSAMLVSGLLFLLTIIGFLISLVVGTVCNEILDETNPLALVGPLVGMGTIGSTVKVGLGTLRTCAKPAAQFDGSWFTALDANNAAAALGLGSSFTSLSLPKLVASQFDSLNLRQTVNDQLGALSAANLVNVGSAQANLDELRSPSSPLATIDLSFFTTMTASIDPTDLNTLKATIDNMNTLMTGGFDTYLTAITPASPNGVQKASMEDHFKTLLTAASSAIDTAISRITAVDTAITNVKTEATNLGNARTAVQAAANTVQTKLDEAVAAVTTFLDDTRTLIADTRLPAAKVTLVDVAYGMDAAVARHIGCKPLAQGAMATVNGVCAVVGGGLDGTWMGTFLAACVGFLSLFAMVKIGRAIRAIKTGAFSNGYAPVESGKKPSKFKVTPLPSSKVAPASPTSPTSPQSTSSKKGFFAKK